MPLLTHADFDGENPEVDIAIAHANFPADKILRSINGILSKNILMSLATTQGGKPYSCSVYFGYDKGLCIFFLSELRTDHAKNIIANGTVSGTIADSRQVWERPRKGIQFRGNARRTTPKELPYIIKTYFSRFPGLRRVSEKLAGRELPVSIRPFVVRPTYLKIYDETVFGRETWVELELPIRCV